MSITAFTQYMPHNIQTDRVQADRLVRTILEGGLFVSVHDGMSFTIKRSADRRAILCAMGGTDCDTLTVRRDDGELVGTFLLIYGNGVGELVADYSIDPDGLMQALYDEWVSLFV